MLDPEVIVGDLDFTGNQTIRETIYKAIKQSIIDGKLSVGDRIVEKTFAEAFRVSRTPVREALRRLETEGHVEYIPRTGVVVSGVSKADVIEVYKIRKSLEALMLAQVIDNCNEDDIKKLENYLITAERDITNTEITEVMEHYESFNAILLSIAEMPRLATVLSQIKEYVFRFRRISASKETRRKEVAEEHKRILDAIKANDLESTVRLNDAHLDRSLDVILSELFN